mmetsp:Transcript_108516/g.263806  ORF Transcript_108516/g.263806 Transcript_108516/m.263806 type:complete len:503 (-) Transcript_108516:124-1632(-)
MTDAGHLNLARLATLELAVDRANEADGHARTSLLRGVRGVEESEARLTSADTVRVLGEAKRARSAAVAANQSRAHKSTPCVRLANGSLELLRSPAARNTLKHEPAARLRADLEDAAVDHVCADARPSPAQCVETVGVHGRAELDVPLASPGAARRRWHPDSLRDNHLREALVVADAKLRLVGAEVLPRGANTGTWGALGDVKANDCKQVALEAVELLVEDALACAALAQARVEPTLVAGKHRTKSEAQAAAVVRQEALAIRHVDGYHECTDTELVVTHVAVVLTCLAALIVSIGLHTRRLGRSGLGLLLAVDQREGGENSVASTVAAARTLQGGAEGACTLVLRVSIEFCGAVRRVLRSLDKPHRRIVAQVNLAPNSTGEVTYDLLVRSFERREILGRQRVSGSGDGAKAKSTAPGRWHCPGAPRWTWPWLRQWRRSRGATRGRNRHHTARSTRRSDQNRNGLARTNFQSLLLFRPAEDSLGLRPVGRLPGPAARGGSRRSP